MKVYLGLLCVKTTKKEFMITTLKRVSNTKPNNKSDYTVILLRFPLKQIGKIRICDMPILKTDKFLNRFGKSVIVEFKIDKKRIEEDEETLEEAKEVEKKHFYLYIGDNKVWWFETDHALKRATSLWFIDKEYIYLPFKDIKFKHHGKKIVDPYHYSQYHNLTVEYFFMADVGTVNVDKLEYKYAGKVGTLRNNKMDYDTKVHSHYNVVQSRFMLPYIWYPYKGYPSYNSLLDPKQHDGMLENGMVLSASDDAAFKLVEKMLADGRRETVRYMIDFFRGIPREKEFSVVDIDNTVIVENNVRPGIIKFLKTLRKYGKLVFVTSRAPKDEKDTMIELKKFGLWEEGDDLVLVGTFDKFDLVSDAKFAAREELKKKYGKLIFNAGDNLSDLFKHDDYDDFLTELEGDPTLKRFLYRGKKDREIAISNMRFLNRPLVFEGDGVINLKFPSPYFLL